MKKIFLSLIFSIGILFSMSSCISSAYAQDVIVEDDGVGVSMGVVVRYGTPYYFEGSILYYLYNGWYYYPYCVNNNYYFHRYRRVLPSPNFYDWYKPIPKGHIHPRPHHNVPHHRPHATPHRPHHNHHGNMHRPPSKPNHRVGGMNNRPQRSSTRGGHFGGRR